MSAFEAAQAVRGAIEAAAKELGDTVLHSWVFDLQDGTFNVKAIIKSSDGRVTTIGWNLHE